MAVIKSNSTQTLLRDAVVLDLGDVAQQAAALRRAAEQRAARIIADAHRQAAESARRLGAEALERGKAQGYEQGLAQGRKAGHDEAFAAAADHLKKLEQSWRDALTDFDASRADLHRQARAAVLDLALKLAEKIVHRVALTDRSVVLDQVAAALALVLKPVDVTIHVNPTDRPVLEEALPQLLAKLPQLQHVHLADDPAIAAGGCVVSYGQGRIDATIDTQLQRIVDLIRPVEPTT